MPFPLHLPRVVPAFAWGALWRAIHAKPAYGVQKIQRAMASVHALAKGSTYTLLRPEGVRVECLEGCVWITLDRDIRDTVLEAGESYCADHQSRSLIHALNCAKIRISPPPRQ